MRRRAERIDKDQTRVAATDAVRCGGPPDYEKASKQHATDGKDIRRATDTDLFASQRKLGEDPAGFAERAGAGPRRSGLHACAGYNRRDQLDLIGAWLAALSRGEFPVLLRRCHRLRSLTRSAPASSLPDNHCATTTGRLLEGVRSRLACPRPVIVDAYASVTCAATSNVMAAQSRRRRARENRRASVGLGGDVLRELRARAVPSVAMVALELGLCDVRYRSFPFG